MPAAAHRWLVAILVALLLAVVGMPHAAGHSFLARTQPAQGERLADPPRDVLLQFSEPMEPDRAQVSITDDRDGHLEAGRLTFEADSRVVRVPLVSPGGGLYRVSWHVVSAMDGHQSAGEFLFTVGDSAVPEAAGALPGASTRPSPAATAATWILLTGWSIAFAAAVLALATAGVAFPGQPRTWIRAGALSGLVALAVRTSFLPGQAAHAVALVAGLMLATAVGLAAARRSWPALTALAGFAVIWPARGHAAATPLGWALDSVHLAAAGMWVGGLSVVLLALLAAARRGTPRDVLPLVRAYARLAVVAVIALLGTGVALAWTLLPDPGSLLGDRYGRLVTFKTVLAVAAVGTAVVARRRLAAADLHGIRRVSRPEYVILATALATAAVLVDTPPRPPTVDLLLGPPPIDGPVARAAGMAGHITLDVQAGDGRLDVNARGPSGGINASLTLAVLLPTGQVANLHPQPCGTGCATLRFALPEGQSRLIAHADADGWTGGATTLVLHWPPAEEDPSRFERMRRTMRAVETVTVVEEFDTESDPDAPGVPLTGRELVDLMPWAGGGVSDVRPVPGETGRFTFYLSGSHMWFDATVDADDRLVSLHLVNPGHDIRYRFRYPDQP